MHPAIVSVTDSLRGCGWRKEGGLYLVSGELMGDCGLLPIPLTVCPCCGQKMQAENSAVPTKAELGPARGWTWIQLSVLRAGLECDQPKKICRHCRTAIADRCGLLWVGAEHYQTSADFVREALEQGISRRIHQLPRDFVVGETVVCLAHRLAIHQIVDTGKGKQEIVYTPGIFAVFLPQRVEYVVPADKVDDEALIERLLARGITPVVITRRQAAQATLDGELIPQE